MRPMRLALTKGRLEKKTVEMLEQLGYDCSQVRNKGRRLILPIGEVVLAKAADVVTYVENGVCDMGVVGKDTIMEKEGTFYEVTDLGFGKCRFALAAKKGTDFYKGYQTRTIASKYVNVAHSYFQEKNMDVNVVKIDVCQVSARLIVNIASMKLRKQEVEAFLDKIEEFVEKKKQEEECNGV